MTVSLQNSHFLDSFDILAISFSLSLALEELAALPFAAVDSPHK